MKPELVSEGKLNEIIDRVRARRKGWGDAGDLAYIVARAVLEELMIDRVIYKPLCKETILIRAEEKP